jgi:hypothetical protein
MTDASSITHESNQVAAGVTIEQLDAAATRAAILVTVLRDVVAHGASVGFMSDLTDERATKYWNGVADQVESGTRSTPRPVAGVLHRHCSPQRRPQQDAQGELSACLTPSPDPTRTGCTGAPVGRPSARSPTLPSTRTDSSAQPRSSRNASQHPQVDPNRSVAH